MTRDFKKQAEWRKSNTVFIGLNLNNRTDSDIIEYIDKKVAEGETKQGVIKRSLKQTMKDEGYSVLSDSEEAQDVAADYGQVAEKEPEYSPDPGEKE